MLAAIAALTLFFTRYRENEKALEKTNGLLAETGEEHARHLSVQTEMEGLSAVGLHRRGLKAQEAVALADEAGGKADAAAQRKTELSAERERITAELTSDRAEIERLLPEITYDSALLAEGEFVAEIGAMIDYQTEHAPSLVDLGSDRIFAKTRAHRIYESRSRRAKAGSDRHDGIALAEEILAEPIVPIRQGPPALPHPNSSILVRSIEQRLGLAPIVTANASRVR